MISVVPELGINIGYQITDHLRAYVGYNVIYWSDVVRPGDQIDRVINTTQLPNPTLVVNGVIVPPQPNTPLLNPALRRPAFSFNGSDFWAQGVNFGLEFKY